MTRPRSLRTIPIEFYTVLIRIAQIERFADAMVARAVELYSSFKHSMQRICQRSPCRIQDRGVKQSGGAVRRRLAALLCQVLRPMWW